jgi:hypothetical protein
VVVPPAPKKRAARAAPPAPAEADLKKFTPCKGCGAGEGETHSQACGELTPPAGFAPADETLAPGKDPEAMDAVLDCPHCDWHFKGDGQHSAQEHLDAHLKANHSVAKEQAPAAQPTQGEATHDQIVAWVKEQWPDGKLPRDAYGKVMGQFKVSFTRANAAIAAVRAK